MSTVKKLMSGLEKKYWIYTLLSPLSMVGEVVMETVIPYIMAQIIDVGIANRDINYVVKTGLLMIGAACLSLACGVLGGRFSAVASQGFSHNLRRNLFSKVLDFSFRNVDRFSSASLVTRLTTDVTNTQNFYQMLIRMAARAPFMLISGTIMACLLNAHLATVFWFVIPVLVIAIYFISTTAYPRYRAMLGKYDKMNNSVQENLIAIRVVKSFVREKFESKKFDMSAADVRDTQVHAEKIVIFLMPIMQISIYLSIILVMWFGGNMIVQGTMLTGELISFITYVTQILMSLMMLGMIFVMFVLSRASISRIIEVLGEKIDIENPSVENNSGVISSESGSTQDKVRNGSVDFNDVSFSYDNNPDNCVLSHINMHIKSGSVVGLIGGTGSSKTTLVQLIPRLYDVLSGSVSVGGRDVKKYDLIPLRDSVAMVLQKNVLFSGTIRENLCWGNKNATEEQIIAACRAADAHDFIMSFPDGYETYLGQSGVNVSGGQKQRLCIARALLKNPKILILDDSTSAVDTATESHIREALKKEHPETTKIIIAQRITSVKDADIIYVLDDGKINGSGTHDELMKSNEIYREVFESQQKGGDADMPPEGGN